MSQDVVVQHYSSLNGFYGIVKLLRNLVSQHSESATPYPKRIRCNATGTRKSKFFKAEEGHSFEDKIWNMLNYKRLINIPKVKYPFNDLQLPLSSVGFHHSL